MKKIALLLIVIAITSAGFTAGQAAATFAQPRVQTARQAGNHIPHRRLAQRRRKIAIAAKPQVVAQARIQEVHRLRHPAEARACLSTR